jgi:hypothetical protein
MRHPGTTNSKRLPVELLDNAGLLAALGQCRQACTGLCARTVIGSPAYQSASAIVQAIDVFAEVLTGSRTHFHLKAHTADTAFKG